MPITYDIDTDRRVVIAASSGTLTETEIVAAATAAYKDPRFDPAFRAFFDHSQVSDWKVSSSFMTRMASARRRDDHSRTAVFVQGALGYGLVRAYQAFVDNGQVKVFTDRAEALAWLNEGVPPEQHIK